MDDSSVNSDISKMVLTPTTLARYEAELSRIQTQAGSSRALANQSHLWHGRSFNDDDDDADDDNDDDSSLDSNSNLSGAANYSTNNNVRSFASVRSQPKDLKLGEPKQRKLPGPRPSKTLEEMTPLEAERRKRRRERNKNAAAKCRQRRVEQTSELIAKTEELEQQSSILEREIQNLRRVKNQLEYVLDAHKPTCTADFTNIKSEEIAFTSLPVSTGATALVRPSNLPISVVPSTCRSSLIGTNSGTYDAQIFSFDTPTTLAGLTPMLMGGDLSSPSSFIMLSPSTLIAQ